MGREVAPCLYGYKSTSPQKVSRDRLAPIFLDCRLRTPDLIGHFLSGISRHLQFNEIAHLGFCPNSGPHFDITFLLPSRERVPARRCFTTVGNAGTVRNCDDPAGMEL
jgi:hypothetical protein